MEIPKRTLGRTNVGVSLLGLGTAEIGFPYGIEAKYKGSKDLLTDEEAERFLKSALELGVTYFDTARAYELAEERIGKSGIAKKEGVLVGTKCAKFLEKGENPSPSEMEAIVRAEVDESRKKLDMDVLPLLFFHGGSKAQIEEGIIIEIMQKLRDEEKILFTGISLRGEEAALAAVESDFFDVIEIAHSILDQRLVLHVLTLAKEKNIGVINRSVLMKGALTDGVHMLPDKLAKVKENSEKARAIAEELGISLPSLAIRFAISNPAVSTALIGTATLSHLETAKQAIEQGPLPEDVLARLRGLAIDDPEQVDPSLWPSA